MGRQTVRTTRSIVHIDQDKCDGCGLCVPACAEGAIRVIDGKARLVADNLCDGLGDCLGTCPKGAISIEERPAEPFDEQLGESHRRRPSPEAEKAPDGLLPCGCPGSAMRKLDAPARQQRRPNPSAGGRRTSRLGHWPVQLALLPEQGDVWSGADVLIAADCVAFALPDFHDRLLGGRTLAVACPKLDDAGAHAEKLGRVFAGNEIRSVTIARMEVPCCGGLERIVAEALAAAGADVPVTVVTVGAEGGMLDVRTLAKEAV
jgi:ferredoxin